VLRSKSKIIPFSFILRVFLFSLLSLLLFTSQQTLAYDYQKAAEYIKNNYNNYDPNYWNFDSENTPLGGPPAPGDCANFLSQALINGNIDLTKDLDAVGYQWIEYNGEYYKIYDDGRIENPNGKITFSSPVSLNRDEEGNFTLGSGGLRDYLVNVEHWENYPIHESPAMPSFKTGDVIVFWYSNESGVPEYLIDEEGYYIGSHIAGIVGIDENGNPILGGHNPNGADQKFYELFYGPDSYYKFDRAEILHFPTADEAGQPIQFWGTGDYYGPEALAITIYEAGHNYLGWIVNNTDSSDQDMVVGEDTSNLQGCTYYIRAWCTNANKGIPDSEDAFSQPWTSDDPSHWAYWIRQAVVYGTENAYSDSEILDAVWYITDRSGSYNEILTSIEYPEDGPQKPTDTDTQPPAEVSSLTATAGDGKIVLEWINPDDADFLGTVIRYRTDGIYPTDPTDGTFVISKVSSPGRTDSFTHTGLTNGTTYYYTAFAYDEVSNYSTGVQIEATPQAVIEEGVSGGGAAAGRCFIATAIYGSPLHPDVQVLRNFKNEYILTNSIGKALVKFYYKVSPPLADYIKEHKTVRKVARFILLPVVYGVKYPEVSILICFSIIVSIALIFRHTQTKVQ
jgi:hypothetical protein